LFNSAAPLALNTYKKQNKIIACDLRHVEAV